MRIISGSLKGRRFHPPADKWPTRPTTDIAREGLFNILQFRIDFANCRMLDLFGGTGSHCFEFISRGCGDATYVDKHGPAVRFVKKQSEEWSIADRITVVRSDVRRFIDKYEGIPFDYIFAGPPYPLPWLDEIPALVLSSGLMTEGALFVLEHNPNHDFAGDLRFLEARNYGSTIFSFFKKAG